MDIKKLIEDGYVDIQGFIHAEWVRRDAELYGSYSLNPGNYTPGHKGNTQRRMFGVAFNQPVGNEFLVTTVIFDMSSAYGFRWLRPKRLTDPWEGRRRVNPDTCEIVSDTEVEQIKTDPDFKKLVEDWAESLAPVALKKLASLKYDLNNKLVKEREEKKAKDATQKKLDDYALSLDPEKHYGWESEWTHTNYDPYNGSSYDSGPVDLAAVARADGANTEEKIDKLFKGLCAGGRVDTYGDKTHTWYWKMDAKQANESRTFKVKNYRGNLVESIASFQKKFKRLRVVEAKETPDGLSIRTKNLKG